MRTGAEIAYSELIGRHVCALCSSISDSVFFALFGFVHSNPARPKVTSNATWALGELALKVGAAIGPAAGPSIERLCAIINDGERNAVIRRYDIKHVVFKLRS
jgi:hypothetical protein